MAVRIHAALPQTQCTRCGYPDCAAYADAIAEGTAGIDQCPPGGDEGIARLATLTGLPVRPLNPAFGQLGPRQLAVVDEDWCIGCTKCLEACPTDAIVGIHKRMHTVIETHCTGCELCLPVCPVDCITMETATPGRTGWQAWSQAQADHALARYQRRSARLDAATAPEPAAHTTALSVPSQSPNSDPAEVAEARKRAMVQAAMARARAASNR